MSCAPFGCKWDSGQVGFIIATPEKIRKEFGKRITKKVRLKVDEILRNEVKVYDQHLRGAKWGYIWNYNKTCAKCGHSEEVIDSCWGFLGDTLEETGILAHLPPEAHELAKKAWEARFNQKGD
jgi:hypothetical protein